ncbi:phasin family protein [Halomonas halocynthiae]|uniref:phasin family protein n=1 Tax=Halomonas halocynthiae TaxID=176290 RepID=UPI00041E13E8|nr:phasin family protein [Halomonas halocynthiae]
MSNDMSNKFTEQLEEMMVSPLRGIGAMNLEFTEKMVNAQLDSARAMADLGLAQARVWLEVKDADGFKQAVESQQKAAQQAGERLKKDSEALMSLSQDYLQKGQKMTEEQGKKVQKAADEQVKSAGKR